MGHSQGERRKDRCERSCYRFHPHRHWKIRHRNVSSGFDLNWRGGPNWADIGYCRRKTGLPHQLRRAGRSWTGSQPGVMEGKSTISGTAIRSATDHQVEASCSTVRDDKLSNLSRVDSKLSAICCKDFQKVILARVQLDGVVAPLVSLNSSCLTATLDYDRRFSGVTQELLAEEARGAKQPAAFVCKDRGGEKERRGANRSQDISAPHGYTIAFR